MMPVTWPPWSSTEARNRAHQPDRAAAIDQADVVLGEDCAEGVRGRDEARVGAGAGTAIDADITNRAHALHCGIAHVKGRKGGPQRLMYGANAPIPRTFYTKSAPQ